MTDGNGISEEARRRPSPVAVARLKLSDFRNYAALDLALCGRAVVLVGENGAGKTNLLEAVSFLSPGRGLRRATLEEVARFGGSGTWAVAASLEGPDGQVQIGTGLAATGGETRTRTILIDHEPARSADALLDHCRVLWLTPAMDGLFTGPAGDRRRFLDRLVLSMDAGHGARVSAYERAIRGRNRLLEEARPDARWLDALETEIAELAVAIAAARRELVGALSAAIAQARGASAFPHAELALEGTLERELEAASAVEAEDRHRARLREGRGRDAAAGRTLEGPHRSDLLVTHGPKGVAAGRASTGEQKALLLGLVLAQARVVGRLTGRAAILLLDEVAAHLDAGRRAALFDTLEDLGGQAFMTGTDAGLFEAVAGRAEMFTVAEGRLERRQDVL